MLGHVFGLSAQPPLNRIAFFEENELITMDLNTDLKKLVSEKKLDSYQPATLTCHFPDSIVINEEIRLTARGEFRRVNCFMPTMKLDFRNTTSPKLAPLGLLKLVCACSTGPSDERLVLREFLTYKIYNLLTDMSFRVRLLRINYKDTRGKIKSYSQYGFFIEATDDMAKRNKCREVNKPAFHSERTNRQQMTLVSIFQYMIGNTDWSVPAFHNIKLMRSRTDSLSSPYTIPYDFDFCGLVNANYASPPQELDITSVRERAYRGFQRSSTEIEDALKIFHEKKQDVEKLVMNFEILDARSRKDIMKYLDEFYAIIDNKKWAQRIFVDGARSD
jgi:hypothetical protein